MRRFYYVLLVVCCSCGGYRNTNPLLTTDHILGVEAGMTMEEVKAILGEPVSTERQDDYDYSCDCNPERLCHRDSSFTFTYTRRLHNILYPYPMVWVHFNERKRVTSVYIKRYSFWDDPCIYGPVSDECDSLPNEWKYPIMHQELVRQSLDEFFRSE